MPSMRVSFNPPVDGGLIDLKRYKRDLYILIEEAVILAARDVYNMMVARIPVYTGFSQGAVSNLAGARLTGPTPTGVQFKGTPVGNPNDKGNFSSKTRQHPEAKRKLQNAVIYKNKSFITGKQYATDPLNILTIDTGGQIHFKFKVDISYWLAKSPKDNTVWGELSQYRDVFRTKVLEHFKPPGLENYINSRVFKGRS